MDTIRITFGFAAAISMLAFISACDSNVERVADAQSSAESEVIEPLPGPETKPDNTVMAFGRFVPEREDDFAWENDKVAFRVYGPASGGKGQVSGVDAWLKRVSYPVIDKWYAGFVAGKSYHEDHGEGYDPYHVGDSRGVGGTAIWIDGQAWPAGKFKRYELLQSGGEVVEFNLQTEWDTPLGLVAESKTISLALGEQLYRVNSVFTLNGKPASVPVAIGLTTHDEKAQVFSNPVAGRISTWELIDEMGLGTGVLILLSKFCTHPAKKKTGVTSG